ncbi:Lrp/AsnC family transcriptional regulator [Spirochaetota bacterium]
MKLYKIDETGEKILEILSTDAKATADEIAKQINIKEEEVKKYIDKYEKDKIILGYKAHVNWQRIRQHDVKALIEVKIIPERKVGFDAVAESIFRFPEVTAAYLLSGGYDLLVLVEGENLNEVALFVSEKLATVKGVQSTVSHFQLKTYKEDGIVFIEQKEAKRLPVTP